MPADFRILLLTPPLVPPNAPYPATPFLTASLRQEGWDVRQADLSIALLDRILSRATLADLAETARTRVLAATRPEASVIRFLSLLPRYLESVEGVLAFLRGLRPDLPGPLPEGPRFRQLAELRQASSPLAAKAAADPRLRASLFLDDVVDFLREGVDSRFGFARYAEHLGRSAPSFAGIAQALAAEPSPIDRLIGDLTVDIFREHTPALVGLTVPFPGNLYAALRIARTLRTLSPTLRIVLGGGFISTELRDMSDPALFETVDALVFDDGEIPLRRYAKAVASGGRVDTLPRVATRLRLPPDALADNPAGTPDRLRHRDRPAPTYDGLPLDRYFGLTETPNPMHRLWSERFWNKFTLAHGCYWHRCAFCDTSLDYIRRYDPADVETVLGWMDALHAQTGQTGFHFVDEAAPPALLRRLALRLAARGKPYTWWTNIRLDPTFDADLAKTLAQGGCIAVTAGLECATDRLLALMDKGVGLSQAVRACEALAGAGLLVHAYLMYGFPTETAQETLDALEVVRLLFLRNAVHSAFWHRFALTCHSPAFGRCRDLGLVPSASPSSFARNEVPYRERGAPDHDALGEGLNRATYNFMLGVGLREDVRAWFEIPVPKPSPSIGGLFRSQPVGPSR